MKPVCELALFASNGGALGKEKIKAENAKLRPVIENMLKKETKMATIAYFCVCAVLF